jgi:hypothetical protein
MKHFIYSIHAIGGSKWSEGYTEYYITDILNPSKDNPVMSVIVLQVGETIELFNGDLQEFRPSNEVTLRICRALYYGKNEGYGIKEQKGYLFPINKNDIPNIISNCLENIDYLLNGKVALDINSREYLDWEL